MKMVIIANSIKINSIFCNSTKLANQALIKESDRSLLHTPLRNISKLKLQVN